MDGTLLSFLLFQTRPISMAAISFNTSTGLKMPIDSVLRKKLPMLPLVTVHWTIMIGLIDDRAVDIGDKCRDLVPSKMMPPQMSWLRWPMRNMANKLML